MIASTGAERCSPFRLRGNDLAPRLWSAADGLPLDPRRAGPTGPRHHRRPGPRRDRCRRRRRGSSARRRDRTPRGPARKPRPLAVPRPRRGGLHAPGAEERLPCHTTTTPWATTRRVSSRTCACGGHPPDLVAVRRPGGPPARLPLDRHRPRRLHTLSARAPDDRHNLFRTDSSERFVPAIASGDRLVFHLHANPVVSEPRERKPYRMCKHDIVTNALRAHPETEHHRLFDETVRTRGFSWLETQGRAKGFAVEPDEIRIHSCRRHEIKRRGRRKGTRGQPPLRHARLRRACSPSRADRSCSAPSPPASAARAPGAAA